MPGESNQVISLEHLICGRDGAISSRHAPVDPYARPGQRLVIMVSGRIATFVLVAGPVSRRAKSSFNIVDMDRQLTLRYYDSTVCTVLYLHT